MGNNRIKIKARIIYCSEKIKSESDENDSDNIDMPTFGNDKKNSFLSNIKEGDINKNDNDEKMIVSDKETTQQDKCPIKGLEGYLEIKNEPDRSSKSIENILLKPIFVPKSSREIVKEEEYDKTDINWEKEDEYRKSEAKEMFLDFIQRDRISKENSKLKTETEIMSEAFDSKSIDDTDGLDEIAEKQAWELRELHRIKREKEQREQWELQKIEQERIRNMTEEEKQKIDKEKEAEWLAQPKSQYKFLQKYYHKGAFFMDSNEPLLQRDYSQPTGEDRNNKEMLPETKQKKNFGKKSQSKWTHLTNEDTTCFDYGWGWKKNELNQKTISKMSGMKSDLDNPSKKYKNQ